MKQLPLCLLMVSVLSACAAVSKKEVRELTEAEKKLIGYKCEKVKITGSNLSRKICTTKAQRVEMERRAQENFRKGIRKGGGSVG